MLQLKTTAKVEPRYIHWFFHGLTRSGKTIAASTFPTPLLIVPKGEGSHVSLYGREAIDYFEVGGMGEMEEALAFLENRHDMARKLWQQGKTEEGFEQFPWQTVVIESISHYCDLLVEDLSAGGTREMDYRQWGRMNGHLRGIKVRLSKMPVYAVFVALSKVHRDKKGDVDLIEPSFPSAQAEKIPASCDVVVYFERKPGKPLDRFVAHFNRAGPAVAGSRYDLLTQRATMAPFNFAEVAKILGLDV